jgi:hypothetical protein
MKRPWRTVRQQAEEMRQTQPARTIQMAHLPEPQETGKGQLATHLRRATQTTTTQVHGAMLAGILPVAPAVFPGAEGTPLAGQVVVQGPRMATAVMVAPVAADPAVVAWGGHRKAPAPVQAVLHTIPVD